MDLGNVKNEIEVVFKSYFNKKNFTQVSNFVVRDSKLSSKAKLIYIYLMSFAWDKDSCFVGRKRMMSELGLCKNTILKHLRELKVSKLIKWQRRPNQTNLYYLLDGADKYKEDILQIGSSNNEPTEAQIMNPKNTQYNNTKLKKELNKKETTEQLGIVKPKR